TAEKNLARLHLFVVDRRKGIRPTVTVLDSDGDSPFKDILVTVQEAKSNKAVIQRLKLDVDELRERVKALEQQLSETTKESSNSQADQPPPLIRLGSPNMEPEPSVMYEMLGDRERQLSALAVNGNKSLTETDPVWVGRIITVDHILDM